MNAFAFERYVQRRKGRPGLLDRIKVGEVRVFTQPRQLIRQAILRRLKAQPDAQFSWALNVPGKVAVRRDQNI